MSWHPVAPIVDAELARAWLPVRVEDRAIDRARIGDEWYAVEDRCTHAGCAFSEDATLEGATIVCDCHGSEFDLRTGGLRRGPAERPVRAFAVRVAHDVLEVEL